MKSFLKLPSLKPLHKNLVFIFIGILISLLGYYLRLQQFDVYPPVGDTYDEIKGAFNGISLIKNHVPESWSWFGEYKDAKLPTIRGTHLRIVKPWFDEPPLFSLMEGGYSIYKGMATFEKVNVGVLRYPMLKFGALNIFLLFILVLLIRNIYEAILAALFYATEPTIIISSRLPISDNMIVTTVLLSLVLLVLYFKKNHKAFLISSLIIGTSAFFMKTPGIFVPISLIGILISQKKIKDSFLGLGILILAVLGWFAYGYYYNWTVFTSVLFLASGRELYVPNQILNLFEVFRIGESNMAPDGLIVWGWICVVIYSFIKFDFKDNFSKLIFPITLGSYLVFFSIMSGHVKGWYRFPFYPFLAWAVASIFVEIFRNPRVLSVIFFTTIPFFTSYILGRGGKKWTDFQAKNYQIIFVFFMSIPMLYEIFRTERLKLIVQGLLIISFGLMIIFNIQVIIFHQGTFWFGRY